MAIHKKEASSLTVSSEVMMMSYGINTKEGIYVIVTDITPVFLHADMNDNVHMVLEGTIAEHIAKLELTIYRKYIWHGKKGNTCCIYSLRKLCTVPALLFWKLLSDTLISWGFMINPYD